MYTIVITAGQLVRSNIQKSISAFANLTSPIFVGAKISILSEYIDSYKKGEIDTMEFFESLQGTLQEGNTGEITIKQIEEAWNAMSVISSETIMELHNLAYLQERLDLRVVVVGRTNKAHNEFEEKQLADANVGLRYERINSFEHHTLDVNKLLLAADLDRDSNVIISFIREDIEVEKARLVRQDDMSHGLFSAVETSLLKDIPKPPLVRLSSRDRYGFGASEGVSESVRSEVSESKAGSSPRSKLGSQ